MEINATILVSAVSFIVFILIMNKLLYAPVMKIMEARGEYIENNKNEASLHENNSKKLVEDKNDKIAGAQRKSRDIVAAKAEALKEEKSKVLNDTKITVNTYFNEQKQNLASQKDEATDKLKSDVADLANGLTSKLLGEGVTFEPLNGQEIDEVMKKNV